MENVTVREIQHHLSTYIQRVENGEEIQISRRNRPVAKIVPLPASGIEKKVDWIAHRKEVGNAFMGRIVRGKPMHKIVSEARGEY